MVGIDLIVYLKAIPFFNNLEIVSEKDDALLLTCVNMDPTSILPPPPSPATLPYEAPVEKIGYPLTN